MRISIIVAMAENAVIGRAGALPWKISKDLQRFKKLTINKPIIMGRKTFHSIGKPLPERANIVISRDTSFKAKGVHVVHGFKQAIDKAAVLCGDNKDAEAMIIGGAEIYRMALAHAGRLYLTEVHGNIDGDTRFPDFDRCLWHEVAREDHAATNSEDYAYSFIVLERLH